MRLLAAVMTPDEGSIAIEGLDVVANPEVARADCGLLWRPSALRSWLPGRPHGDPGVRGQAGDQLMRGIIDVDADPIDERHPFGVRLDALGGEFGRLGDE